jgi:predicted ATPase
VACAQHLRPKAIRSALAYFEQALAVSRQQQAKSWELRATTSLARLWRDQGRPQQRANCLFRFTAGLLRASTRELKEAKALLDELHA